MTFQSTHDELDILGDHSLRHTLVLYFPELVKEKTMVPRQVLEACMYGCISMYVFLYVYINRIHQQKYM